MVDRFNKLGQLKKKFKMIINTLIIILVSLSISSCQQSSEDSSVSANTDQTAPTTTITAGSGCTLAGLTISDCTVSPVTVIFTANETATIYYAQDTSSGVSVSTSSSSISSGDSIDVTGTEGDIVYVAFFAQDEAGNSETSRELTITIPDLTSPTTTVDFSGADCTGTDMPEGDYQCSGTINVTINIVDNSATTIYFDVTSDNYAATDTSSDTYGTGISVDTHDSYLSFFAQDAFGNVEAIKYYHFDIDGLSISGTNGGYYNSDQSFQFVLDASRDTPNGYYQLWYLVKTGTDASADSTADIDSVFTSGTNPTANADATMDVNTYPTNYDATSNTITTVTSSNSTAIYQYKYNIIYDGTQDATGDIQGGSVDTENTLVLFIDKDTPKSIPLPPSSGSLDSTIQVSSHIVDNGHRLIDEYGTTNTNLFAATPQDFTETQYCNPSTIYDDEADFWNYCLDTDNRLTLSNGDSLNLTVDTQLGLAGVDAAGNKFTCDGGTIHYTCKDSSPSGTEHFVEAYTPGMMQTSYYHDNQTVLSTWFTDFGHTVATGDLDNDGTNDIIAVGAPAYSHTLGLANVDNGAVYIWYDDFRERAILQLADNDITTDVTDRWMEFTSDGDTDTLRVFLDPSTDTSAYGTGMYQADSVDYTDKTQATASEITAVLNNAFLNSFGETYQNNLYADSSTDSKLSIGHINRTIDGYFSYTSNFDTTSDLYHSGSNDIKAYDYVIYGENADDEFGYSLAIGQVDTSVDTTTYAASQLIVGAPGYGTDDGAVYVIRLPTNDASADYGKVTLFDSTTDAHKFHASSNSGRLGHAIALYDTDSDGYDDIYTSAPYYSGTYTNSGAVYNIDQQVFTYSAASNDISTDAASRYIWTGQSYAGDEADNALFGYSLAAGQVLHTNEPNSKHLFVGIPGTSSPSTEGKVAYLEIWAGFPINSEQSLDGQTLGFFNNSDYDSSTPTENNFGYSLEIVDNAFESSSSQCPCLVVGAPLADSSLGKIWILGDGTYAESLTGTTADDQLGTNIHYGTLWSDSSIFIAGRRADNEGIIMIAEKQTLSSGTSITASEISNAITAIENDNTGSGLAVVTINGSKALLVGITGGSGSGSDRFGRIRIYSPARLTP